MNSSEPIPAPTGGQGLTTHLDEHLGRTQRPRRTDGPRPIKHNSTEMTEIMLSQLQSIALDTRFINLKEVHLQNKRRTVCEMHAALTELRRFIHRIEATE